MKADNVLESEIVSLLEEGELCPVCRSMEKSVDGWIVGAFSNLLHNESARIELKRNGLCKAHLKRIVGVAKERTEVGSLAVSIMFKEILAAQVTWLDRKEVGFLSRKKPKSGSCVLCSVASNTEKIYLSAFAKFLQGDEVQRSYENSRSVFCVNHARYIIKNMRNLYGKWLVEIQRNKYEELAEEIENYISKHDYRNTTLVGQERHAWLKASKLIGERDERNIW
ncbi:MAG: hypothetical protein JW697_05115 [Kosmotogaceae bacterium]|nr:hypothetical protein [Kosmotogaceae bacterium]